MSKDDHQLGDAPIEGAYRRKMQALAIAMDRLFNGDDVGRKRGTGFVLLVYPFNDEGGVTSDRCNFISNGADRKDVVALFKEMIARFEGQPEITGHA